MSRPWLLLLALGACAAPEDGEFDLDEVDVEGGGKEDRGGGTAAGFVEVDPTHSTATFRRYIERAIQALEADDSEIARLTAKSIRAGKVKIDELVDMTCWDFERVLREITDGSLTSDDWAHLHDHGGDVDDTLAGEIDGYMWSNRIYVSRGQPLKRLAATLVHETNHVINRSEVGYWDDLPTSAFLHEYRAFYAEAMYDPDAYDGVDLVDHVLDLYELDRRGIRPAALAMPLSPRLLPDAAAWKARRVSADVPDDPASCPGNR